jgi:hypothetical protein
VSLIILNGNRDTTASGSLSIVLKQDGNSTDQKFLHGFGLVGRQIVQHDVDLLGPAGLLYQLPEEDKKLCAGVPFCSLAFHFASLHIQGGIERQRRMAVILETMRSARPGDRGSTGSSRSSAWIAVFSSTQNTAACWGGSKYRPMTSAALASKSGSSLARYRSKRCGFRRACPGHQQRRDNAVGCIRWLSGT